MSRGWPESGISRRNSDSQTVIPESAAILRGHRLGADHSGPIGPIIDGVRSALEWLGPCGRESAAHSMHLTFRFVPEAGGAARWKVKVEINTREHANLLGLRDYEFRVRSDWYSGQTAVKSFAPEEPFGTKLRALLQRRKGRDLFDLNEGLLRLGLDLDAVIRSFDHYLDLEGPWISRAIAEQRLLERFERSLIEDIAGLCQEVSLSPRMKPLTRLAACGSG